MIKKIPLTSETSEAPGGNVAKNRSRFTRIKLGLIAALSLSFFSAQAQYFAVPVTGFNADIVADGTAGTTPGASTTADVDSVNGYVFVSSTFGFGSTLCGTTATSLPASNQITSTNGTNNTGITYTLQGYGAGAATNNNSLRLSGSGSSGKLTPAAPFQASKLYFVCLGGNGAGPFSVVVKYTDSSSETVSSNSAPDWCGGAATYKLTTQQYYRISRTATSCTGAGCQYLYEIPVALSSASYTRTIAYVTIVNAVLPGNAVLVHILAMGAQAPCATPTAQATALVLTPASTGTITGSFSAASPAPTGGYLVVRYPTGSATTLPAGGTTYTVGTTIGAGTVVSVGTGLTFTASGLNGGTGYDFYVYDYATGTTCGGPQYNTVTPLTGTATTNTCGTMNGIIPIGPGLPNTSTGGFTSLTIALAYINANGLGGNTILELQSGYDGSSANETFPITFPVNPCINSTKTLTIRPAAGVTGLNINNTTAGVSTIYLNGATYVTFDGRPGGVGGAMSVPNTGNLAIISTGTTVGSVAIKMANEASNNTFQYCDIQGANATNTTLTECGVVFIGTTTGLNGNDNNLIDNCNIHESGTFPAIGVYSYGYTATTISAASTLNDNDVVSNCNLYNVFSATVATTGIKCDNGTNAWTINNNHLFQTASRTYTTANTHRGFWITPSNGGGGNGFIITNNYMGGNTPAGTGTYTMTSTVGTFFYGMDISVIGGVGNVPTTATSIQGNTLTNFSLNTLGSTSDWFRFISTTNAGSVNIGNTAGNTLGSPSASGVVTLINTGGTTGSTLYGIKDASTGINNISNNVIGGLTITSSAATISNQFTGIACSGGTTNVINNNMIGSNTIANSINMATASTSTTAQSVTGILVSGGTSYTSISGNTVSCLTNAYASTASAGQTRGIAITSATPIVSAVSNNKIKNLSNGNTGTNGGSTSSVLGIGLSSANAAGTDMIGNTIDSLVNTAPTQNVQVEGIFYAGTASVVNNISKNFIHSLYAATTGTGAYLTAIDYSTGSSNITNNMIRLGLKPDGTDNTNAYTIRGISSNSTSPNYVYYNTIYIGGVGAANTSNTYAFTRSATSGTYDIRNNIFANVRSFTAAGTTGNYGLYFTTSNAGATPNYNLYYAPGTGGIMGYTGTANQAAYAANWVAGDVNSQSGNPNFIAPNGAANAVNLHITPGGSIAESGGVSIAAFTTDIDGDTRQGSAGYSGTGTAPDLGADEFAGTSVIPSIASVSVTPTATTVNCTSSAVHTITANVTATGAAITTAVINYTINGVAQTPIAMTLSSGTGAANSASTYTGSIPAVTPIDATVVWSVVASTASGASATSAAATYQDVPQNGVVAAVTAASSTTCYGAADVLTATFTKPGGIVTVGTGTTTTSNTGYPTAFGNRWYQDWSQVLYTAAELQAAGLSAGNITSIAFNISALGSAAAVSNYTISLANTSQTALTGFTTTGITTAYGPATYTSAVGWNTITFTTPFYWNGTSNIIVDIRGTGINSTYNAATYYTASTANTAVGMYSSSNTPAFYTSNPTPSYINNNKLNARFGGTTSNLPASYSWSDGTTTVGTTNPVTVTPTATSTTYTVTGMYASGCSATASTAVTTNALPTAPTATNSSQCGTQVPTASVTDVNGYSTPTFKWYAASTGGTALQSSTATTYTTAVSASTTFYVSVISPATSCESARTPVTVTVSVPDALTASANGSTTPASSCINAPISLTATQTGSTNTYAYKWTASPQAGSGIPAGGTVGQNISVTPTAGGSFTYTITGIDGSCTAVNTVTITINDPFAGYAPVATVSAATSCSGVADTLKATSIGAGQITVGTGTTTTATSTYAGTAFGNYWYQAWRQFVYTAAELNALGLHAGNITSIAFNVSSVPAPATVNGYSVMMGVAPGTTLTGFTTTGLTTTYTAATITPTTGWNTLTFSTPYNWDGVSNLLIDLRETGQDGSANSVNTYTATSGNTSVYAYTTSNVPTFWTSSPAATATTTRPNIQINGQVIGNATAVTWSNGTTTVGNVSPLAVFPTTNTTYTGTVSYGGCSKPTNAVTVTVNALPTAPTATNSSQCGTQVPTASVTDVNGYSTPTFKWYAASTGGTALQSSTATTYTTAVSASTTFYVSVISPATSCESARTPVTVTVSVPDPLTASANGSTTPASSCINAPISLTATQTGSTNTYAYKWTASPQAGSGIPAGGTVGQNISVTPTAGGSFTYTITGIDGSCTAVNTVTITITDPFNGITPTATASATTSCANAADTLKATIVAPGQITVGTGTTTTATSTYAGTAFGNYWYQAWRQFVYTPAELNALGLGAGNITSIAFNVSSVPAPATVNGYSVMMGVAPGATLSGFTTTGLTTTYTAASITPTTGWNTLTFSTPYYWDGVSNLLIDLRETGQDGSANSVNYYTATTGNTSVYAYTTSNVPTFWTSSPAATATTTRPNIQINGAIVTPATSVAWSNGTTGVGTGSPLAVYPATNTSYTATVTYGGCTRPSNTVSVTVNPAPTAPVATNSAQCGNNIPTASVSDPNSFTTPTIKWYAATTGGTPLQSSTATTYGTAISATTTFYVTVTNPTTGCESGRTPVTVTVSQPDAVAITGPSTLCKGNTLNLGISQTGGNGNVYTFTWSATPATGSGVSGTPTGSTQAFVPTTGGNYTYTVNANDAGGCHVVATLPVSVLDLSASTFTAANPACGSTTGSVAVNVVDALPITYTSTNVYSNDFTSATLTSQASIAGNASITGGLLQLTPDLGTQLGGFEVTNPLAVSPANGLSVDYDFTTDGSGIGGGTGTGADGMSWSFGDDVVPTPSGTAVDGTTVAANATNAENGSGTKLKVAFDAYGTGTGAPAGIYVMYNNPVINQSTTVNSTMLAYSTDVSWKGNSTTKHIKISVDNTGKLTVTVAGVAVLSNVQLPAAYLSANKTAWKHEFSARTGGASETHQLDNLAINYLTPSGYQYSLDGTTWQAANSFTPTQGTYPVYVRYQSNTACSYNLGNAVIAAPPVVPTVSVSPTSASYCVNNTGITLTASGTSTSYAWTPTTGLSASSGASVVASPSSTTTYTVTGTGASGCTATATATVTVTGIAPSVTVSATPASACSGNTTVLTATGSQLSSSIKITEVTLFSAGTGASTYPAYIGTADGDYVEISNISSVPVDISGMTFGDYASNSATASHPFTFPAGTVLPATSAAVLNMGTGTSDPADYYFFTGGTTGSYSSGNLMGVVLKSGTLVVDAVGLNSGYTFAAGTGVTAADWSGYAPSASGYAGTIRTAAVDNNAGSDWTQSNNPPVQSIGTYNGGYTSTGGALTYSWTGTQGTISSPGSASTNVTLPTWTSGTTDTAVYTVTVSSGGSCSNIKNDTVYVNAIPTTPTATNSSQCGFGVPTASVAPTTTFVTHTYNWYAAATGGAPLQSSSSTTYTTAISATTTFYVSEVKGACESGRVMVTASVSQPDPIVAKANGSTTPASICPSTVVALSNTQALNNTTYTSYSWSAAPVTGSGLASASPSSASGNLNVTPTLAGTYTYTLTATNGTCTVQSTVSITLQTPPSVNNVSATPTVTCSGAPVVLSAQSFAGAAGTATIGTQTTISITGGPYREGACTGNKAQYLFTAAELSAAGVLPGNITSVSFNVTGLGSGGAMNNYTIKMANTTATSLTTTFDATTPTVVYGPVSYTAVAGTNTHAFSTPFVWDGTSNVVLTLCHDYLCTGSSTVSMMAVTNQVIYDNSGTLSDCTDLTGTQGTIRPVVSFGAIVGTNVSSSMNFVWNPGSLSGSSVTVNPTNPTATDAVNTYTVTVTDPTTTCFATGTASVTVHPDITGPAATNSSQCGAQVPTASVNDVNGFTTPTYKWYNTAVNGTMLQSSTSHTYTSVVTATTTFYVSVLSPTGCESVRTPVTVTVSQPDPITAMANGSATPAAICLGTGAITLSNTQTGSTNVYNSYSWSASPATGSGLTSASSGTNGNLFVTPTAGATYTYTLTASDGTCSAQSSVNIMVKDPFNGTTVTASVTTATICPGTPDTLSTLLTKNGTGTIGSTTSTTTIGTTTTGTALTPFSQYYSGQRTQYLVLASDLTASGMGAGVLNSLAFYVSTKSSTAAYGNYTINLAPTTATSLSTTAYQATAPTTVWGPTNYSTVSGANTFSFTSPFTWDGTSNIIVEVCYFDGVSTFTNNDAVLGTTETYNCTYGQYSDAGSLCGTTGGTAVTGTVLPVMTFGGNFAPTPSAIAWINTAASSVGSGSPLTLSPTATDSYTAKVTVNGCDKNSNAVTITTRPRPNAAISGTATLCAGTAAPVTVTLSNGTAPYSYSYSNGTTTIPVTNATNTSVNYLSPTANTTYTVVAATDANGCTAAPANLTGSAVVTVNQPGANLSLASATCTAYVSQSGNSMTNYDNSNCELITSLQPSGTAPVSGLVTASITVSSNSGNVNNDAYVRRLYYIEPVNNAANATATVTLYATQADFDNCNTASLALDSNHAMLPSSPTGSTGKVRVMQYHDNGTPGSSPAGSVVITPTAVTWDATNSRWALTFPVTGFSNFYIYASNTASPLPVVLKDITATNEGTMNKVEWHSGVENGLDHYDVMRSRDGVTFEKIDEVKAEGMPYGYITYDKTPYCNMNYYRLNMVALNGEVVTSETVHATVTCNNGFVLHAHPNPVSDVLTVDVENATGNAQILLTDVTGKVINTATVANGQATFRMNGLAAGIYYVRYSDDTRNQTIKVNKQ